MNEKEVAIIVATIVLCVFLLISLVLVAVWIIFLRRKMRNWGLKVNSLMFKQEENKDYEK